MTLLFFPSESWDRELFENFDLKFFGAFFCFESGSKNYQNKNQVEISNEKKAPKKAPKIFQIKVFKKSVISAFTGKKK